MIYLNTNIGEERTIDGKDIDFNLIKGADIVNICCNPESFKNDTIHKSLLLAKNLNKKTGALIGFFDKKQGGKLPIDFSKKTALNYWMKQINLIQNIAYQYGIELEHIKPNEDLYYNMQKKAELLDTFCKFVNLSGINTFIFNETYHPKLLADLCYRYNLSILSDIYLDLRYDQFGRVPSFYKVSSFLHTTSLINKQLHNILFKQKIFTQNIGFLQTNPKTVSISSGNKLVYNNLSYICAVINSYNMQDPFNPQ